jgi:hypothetical protein
MQCSMPGTLSGMTGSLPVAIRMWSACTRAMERTWALGCGTALHAVCTAQPAEVRRANNLHRLLLGGRHTHLQ